ncbi:MAG: PTS sugar transporter subunit IIB [Gemmatimonadetes bacterium]|nr:PTS sugar transporter subunit IIB [Gemmatimonadota bacterium]
MPIVLFRVDERLIHGQVVVGWGNVLHPDRIIVVDEELVRSPWEQELYGLGLPPGLAVEFEGVAVARRQLAEWRQGQARVLVLTRDLRTMRELAEGGLMRGEEVNIGGLHYAPGREQVLPYVYLNADARSEIDRLTSAGVRVSARDLPGSRRIEAAELLRQGR